MIKRNYKNVLFYALLYVGLVSIFVFSPYATDDFGEKLTAYDCSWAECLRSAVFYGNGRFLGNIGLYVSLHSDLIRIFLKPLLVSVMVLCFSYICNIKTLWGKVLSCALLIIPGAGYFSNCYVDNPSFYNYVAPLCFFGIAISIVKYDRKNRKTSAILLVLLLFVSIIMQLFSENSSIIFLLFSLGLCAFDVYSEKKIRISSIMMFIGTAIGLIVMMVLPKYLSSKEELLYDMSEYRSIQINIPYMIGVLAKFTEMFLSAIVVILFLSAIEIYLILNKSKSAKYNKWQISIPIIYTLVSFFYTFFQETGTKINSAVKLVSLGLFIIFLINTIVIISQCIKEKKDRIIIYSLVALAMVSVGMFTVVNQHGYRTFYLPLCIVIGIAFYIIRIYKSECISDISEIKINSILNIAAVCFSICIVFVISLQMLQNYNVSLMRETYVQEKISQGETEIYIPKLPNKRLFCENHMLYCKEYLSLNNEDINISFIEIDEWEMYEYYQSLQDNPFGNIVYVLKNYNFNNGVADLYK